MIVVLEFEFLNFIFVSIEPIFEIFIMIFVWLGFIIKRVSRIYLYNNISNYLLK